MPLHSDSGNQASPPWIHSETRYIGDYQLIGICFPSLSSIPLSFEYCTQLFVLIHLLLVGSLVCSILNSPVITTVTHINKSLLLHILKHVFLHSLDQLRIVLLHLRLLTGRKRRGGSSLGGEVLLVRHAGCRRGRGNGSFLLLEGQPSLQRLSGRLVNAERLSTSEGVDNPIQTETLFMITMIAHSMKE